MYPQSPLRSNLRRYHDHWAGPLAERKPSAMTHYYYGRDGERIDLDTWSRRYDDDTHRIVEQTEIGDTFVSTIWTGLDLGHRPGERPLIFETMIFHRGRIDEEIRRRYPTETDARVGHLEICLELRGELLDLDDER